MKVKRKPKIAVVVPDLEVYGGVPAVAKFLYEIITESGEFQPQLISLATSSVDRNSSRLLSPHTWGRQLKITNEFFEGIPFRHCGANLTEIEIMRYLPRRNLDQIWCEFDLIQIVAGTPAWTMVAKNAKIPVVLQVATLSAVERKTMIERKTFFRRMWLTLMTAANSRIEDKAFERADVIAVENKWLFNLLNTAYPSAKIKFITPGIDTDYFNLSAFKQENYVLSVGRFDDPRKNVRLLFQAFKIFCDNLNSGAKLILAGKTPPIAADLDEARRLGIFEKIQILTDVPVEKIRELYQKATLFVLSSNEEGLGLVLIEAMACGLPVVATRCGGAEEVVSNGETGFLVLTENAAALGEKMAELWQNTELRQRMRHKSRQRAVEKFSRHTTGEMFLRVYRELLDKNSR